MNKKRTVLILFATILLSCKSIFATNVNQPSTENCPAVKQARDELTPWEIDALNGKNSKGCPSIAPDSPLARLAAISLEGGQCTDEAVGTLVAFEAIFQKYAAMCGLSEKEDIFISKFSKDGEVCDNLPNNKINACFLQINDRIIRLKTSGELNSAFNLAQKTVDSNDPTGLSQLVLGAMYGWGEGTTKNSFLSIKWFTKALEKLDDEDTRKKVYFLLGSVYEDINDYKNAAISYQKCAITGDNYCQKGFLQMKKHLDAKN